MKPLSFLKAVFLFFLLLSESQFSFAQTTLTRGPYLQKGTQTLITIRWRTAGTPSSTNSRVRIGTTYLATGLYATIIDDATSTTEHIVNVTGLSPDTKYYYSIGTSTAILQVGTDNFFTTIPPTNTTRTVRIAAFGDCGRNSTTYQDNNLTNYRAQLTAMSVDAPDAWILLGDNAYNAGTDAEYTSNFFNIYGGSILKNHKLYPAPGNHDYGNNAANKNVLPRVMPYYSNFSIPQAGECGGVASSKPNFYSFNIGNIHFLSLDSWGIEADATDMGTASATTTLKTWLTNDMAANTQKWTIAYWHHPPYTKGSHDSDNGGGSDPELPKIRQNFITFLEQKGVDLIICGHSHSYERGYLIKNFTGAWNTFSAATHAVSSSSAKYDGTASSCPYVYNQTPLNHGTVYVVAGSAGASGGTNTGFAANGFPYSVNDAGIFYFEVTENRLDAKMLRSNGTTFDKFTIIKDVNKTTNYSILNGTSQTLTASWPQTGNYTWGGGASGTTKAVSVTPPNNATTNYTVTDAFGCVTDNFAVTTSSTLPVSLLSYNVKLIDKKANVNWSTANEVNNEYFTIERSVDGRDFNAIGTVNGAGNSNSVLSYSFVDRVPLLGTSYYRLSQTNYDEHKDYMGVRRIDNVTPRNFDVKTVSTVNNKLVLQINSSVQGVYQLQVYDVAGREWRNESVNIFPGSLQKEINLSKGIYIWKIKNEKGESMMQKVSIK